MGASASLKVLPSPARPISVVEFANALFSTWRRPSSYGARRSNTFGLAVSGGVDSMALAALCSRIQKTPFESIGSGIRQDYAQTAAAVVPHVQFKAFVVDHGVREGSDVEARAVSNVLERRGIRTQVLKIDWGDYQRPADLPNFESVARKYRFQTLGKACRDSGIDSLFLAHHEDDQAETVLMRLINGHRMFGLVGMKRDSEIPECQGIHGVHESGGLDTAGSHPMQSQESHQYTNSLAIETGGIRVYRPLLGFSKARLIATCKAVQMEWFEDHTNQDPTVTTRNAIRKMYSSHAMPPALTTPAILSLSEKFEIKSNDLLNEARSYLGKSMVKGFEPRTGTLTIRFPDLSPLRNSRSRSDTGLIAALLLRQVITFVTPEEHVHLHSLHGAVERIFPELLKKHAAPARPTAFTVSGVQFRPLSADIQEGGGRCPAAKCTWLISRQPYTSSTHSNRPRIPIPPSTSRPSTTPPWALYDGRFWLRVQNRGTRPLSIRPFLKDDLATFKRSLTKKEQERLRTVLRNLAPGDVRWTLPAIAVRESDGRERVLALPTLGIAVQDVETVVHWDVRYKKVDLEILKCWESTAGRGL